MSDCKHCETEQSFFRGTPYEFAQTAASSFVKVTLGAAVRVDRALVLQTGRLVRSSVFGRVGSPARDALAVEQDLDFAPAEVPTVPVE
jgi:hypothetical protein